MNCNFRLLTVVAIALTPVVLRAQEPPVPPEPPEPPVVVVRPIQVPRVPMMPPLPPMPPTMTYVPAMPPMPPMPPMPVMDFDIDMDISGPMHMAMMFAPQERESEQAREAARQARDMARQQARRKSSEDADYRRGMSYLDHRDYDKAVDSFNRVIESKGDRADGATYWRAYAQHKLGKYDAAEASIQELQKNYPQSRWIEDGKALQVEVRTSKGQPPSPENVTDEEIKLLALRSLMDTDPDRSIPILEKLLKGSGSPRLKEQALFVLAQSRSPKAHDLIAQVAKGSSNPDVQMKAIEYLGVNRSKDNLQLLSDVYKSSNDTHIKRQILRSFMISHDRDALLQAAKTETNPELRLEAIRQLGVMGGAFELYASESTFDAKREIINGLMVGGDGTHLFELAKNEKDAKLRGYAINQLGVMGRSKTGDGLIALYKAESDPNVKGAIINALFVQNNAPAMVDIARTEKDPGVRKRVIEQLSVMHSKEATDFMVELLNK